MVRPTYQLLIDWNNDLDYGDANEDITAYVRGFSCKRGRDLPTTLPGEGYVSAGTLDAELVNTAGRFSPNNASGPLYGNIKPGRRVQLKATYNAVTYTLWTGVLDKIEPAVPGVGRLPIATLTAFGHLSRLVDKNISPPAALAGNDTGALVETVLDEAGIDSTEYAIEAGIGETSRWYIGNRPALAAARELESTELGTLFEAADGKITFHNRHHRLLTAASTTSQATFSDAPAASLGYYSIEQLDSNQTVVNEVLATVPQFTVGAVAVLWTLGETGVEIAPGDSRTFIAEYPNRGNSEGAYVDEWTTTSLSTDVAASGVTPSTDMAVATLFASTTAVRHKTPNWMRIKLQNNHATNVATLTLLQARGTPVEIGDGITVLAESATSKTAYGRRTYQFPGPWLPNTSVAQDYVDFIVSQYAAPITALRLMFWVNSSANHAAQGLGREIGDRITVTATGVTLLGLSGDYWIESIEHRITGRGGTLHSVTYGLSAVTTAGIAGGSYWILDTSLLDTETILAF
jgi:hypothetical protein